MGEEGIDETVGVFVDALPPFLDPDIVNLAEEVCLNTCGGTGKFPGVMKHESVDNGRLRTVRVEGLSRAHPD